MSSLFLLFEVVRECFGFMIHRISSCWIALLEVSGIFETGTKSILSNNWITGELLWMGSYKRGNFTFRANWFQKQREIRNERGFRIWHHNLPTAKKCFFSSNHAILISSMLCICVFLTTAQAVCLVYRLVLCKALDYLPQGSDFVPTPAEEPRHWLKKSLGNIQPACLPARLNVHS